MWRLPKEDLDLARAGQFWHQHALSGGEHCSPPSSKQMAQQQQELQMILRLLILPTRLQDFSHINVHYIMLKRILVAGVDCIYLSCIVPHIHGCVVPCT